MKNNALHLKEMAVMYFPDITADSARRQLKRWIQLNTRLQQDLSDAGYVNGQRVFTPRQVSLIFKHLGEP